MDIVSRNDKNPLIRPSDLCPGIQGMEIACLLNPGVFEMNGKVWLIIRVAERPVQLEGKISFPYYDEKGEIVVKHLDREDPLLDASDPRVIRYDGQDYLTTLSYFRLVCSDDGRVFMKIRLPLFLAKATCSHLVSRIVGYRPWKTVIT